MFFKGYGWQGKQSLKIRNEKQFPFSAKFSSVGTKKWDEASSIAARKREWKCVNWTKHIREAREYYGGCSGIQPRDFDKGKDELMHDSGGWKCETSTGWTLEKDRETESKRLRDRETNVLKAVRPGITYILAKPSHVQCTFKESLPNDEVISQKKSVRQLGGQL